MQIAVARGSMLMFVSSGSMIIFFEPVIFYLRFEAEKNQLPQVLSCCCGRNSDGRTYPTQVYQDQKGGKRILRMQTTRKKENQSLSEVLQCVAQCVERDTCTTHQGRKKEGASVSGRRRSFFSSGCFWATVLADEDRHTRLVPDISGLTSHVPLCETSRGVRRSNFRASVSLYWSDKVRMARETDSGFAGLYWILNVVVESWAVGCYLHTCMVESQTPVHVANVRLKWMG